MADPMISIAPKPVINVNDSVANQNINLVTQEIPHHTATAKIPTRRAPEVENSNFFDFANPIKVEQPEKVERAGVGGMHDSDSELSDMESMDGEEYMEEDDVDEEAQIKEKQEYLIKLARLEMKGHRLSQKFTMASPLQDVKFEYEKISDAINSEATTDWLRSGLMFCVNGIEMMNNKFDPVGIYTNGWASDVQMNLHKYDNVFDELYEKYKGSATMLPELKLLLMLGGSLTMYNITHKMLNPNNPDLLKNLQSMINLQQQAQSKGQPQGSNQMPTPRDAPQMPSGPSFDINSLINQSSRPKANTPTVQEDQMSESELSVSSAGSRFSNMSEVPSDFSENLVIKPKNIKPKKNKKGKKVIDL